MKIIINSNKMISQIMQLNIYASNTNTMLILSSSTFHYLHRKIKLDKFLMPFESVRFNTWKWPQFPSEPSAIHNIISENKIVTYSSSLSTTVLWMMFFAVTLCSPCSLLSHLLKWPTFYHLICGPSQSCLVFWHPTTFVISPQHKNKERDN